MVWRTSTIRLLALIALLMGAIGGHAQKNPTEYGDQPLIRFPLTQLKVNILSPAFGNTDFELEIQTAPRWSFSARIGFPAAFIDLRRVALSRCLVDKGFGMAIGARYSLLPIRHAQGLGLKGNLFWARNQEHEWRCPSSFRPLRTRSDAGFGLHLTFQQHLRGSLFIEPFLGLNLSFFEYLDDSPNPMTQRGFDLQVPAGLMLGLGF